VTTAGTTRIIAAMLFDVSRLDGVPYLGMIVRLTAVAGSRPRCPLGSAARVDPAIGSQTE
jgi:hypothetical protein